MIPAALSRIVRERAGDRCQYCRTSQALQGVPFHIEHLFPASRGGPTASENLTLICPSCNLGKAGATKVEDPDSGSAFPLFNPRVDRWQDHFRVDGIEIRGKTGTGRATVVRLQMNTERRLRLRTLERALGWWPPPSR